MIPSFLDLHQDPEPQTLNSLRQVAMCMRALREGCSPEDLHRLLIGVSVSGTDLLPWFDQLLGCCRCEGCGRFDWG